MAEWGPYGNRECSGRPSLEAFGQRRDKFKLPGRVILESKARTGCSGGHSRKPTGLTVETAEKSEGQKYTSQVALGSLTRALLSPRAVCQPLGRGAGVSPAGLSAAIFPPRLEFFPAGGVAPTPAAGLVAGPAGGGQLFSSSRLQSPLVRSWAG